MFHRADFFSPHAEIVMDVVDEVAIERDEGFH
jgi:hypothetical protein